MRIEPVVPDSGQGKKCEVAPQNDVASHVGILLVEAVHRHDAAAPAERVGEYRLVRDRLVTRVDGLDRRPRRRSVPNEAPAQVALERFTRLGMAAEDELRLRGAA